MTDDALADAYHAGLAAEKAGDLDRAETAYREVLRLDPEDHGGVSIRLAAMGRSGSPTKAPDAYVATLFDQNAETFDDMLVEQLGYAVPMMVREHLAEIAPGPYKRLLDLGCGTGLTGVSLADWCTEITGVDLAEGMLDEAHERDVYDDLYIGEAAGFLEDTDTHPWDLITATDVLPYIGALEPLFDGVTRCLEPRGVLVLSSETSPDSTEDYAVGHKHRFAHSRAYLERLHQKAGLGMLRIEEITVRWDDGAPVPGLLTIARRR